MTSSPPDPKSDLADEGRLDLSRLGSFLVPVATVFCIACGAVVRSSRERLHYTEAHDYATDRQTEVSRKSDKTNGQTRSVIAVWKTLTEVHMKYVTLWFSAAGLGFLILSFAVKTVVVDPTSPATKVGVSAVGVVIAGLAVFAALRIQPRASRFADHLAHVEERMAEEHEGLDLLLVKNDLPQTAMMKSLVTLSVTALAVATLGLLVLLGLVIFWPNLFPTPA